MQLMVTHVHDMNSGRCNQELKGMLASPPTGGMLSCHFLAIESIKKVFFTEFEMQYQKMTKPEKDWVHMLSTYSSSQTGVAPACHGLFDTTYRV